MTSFHCPNCSRIWSQGITRDHQETWCWVCQGNAHQTTTEERDLYRESLEQIRDLGPFITPGIPDKAYVIATLALDPEGCADLARIQEPK